MDLVVKIKIVGGRLRHRWRRSRAAVISSKATPAALHAARAVEGDRLLERPVFILSSVRSGSTLLRVMLNTHSQLHSPHELHLISLGVDLDGRHVTTAMQEIGTDSDHLEYLLWDRLLHREMVRHGKQRLVNKTPSDALMWRRILECWPDAQFIYLQRHPAAVTDSWHRNRSQWTRERTAEDVRRYMTAMELAKIERPGLTVRYEDLTREPERQLRRICSFVGVPFELAMLDYGQADHGRYLAGLGDSSARIKTGRIQPVTQLPSVAEIPPSLREISRAWGYVS